MLNWENAGQMMLYAMMICIKVIAVSSRHFVGRERGVWGPKMLGEVMRKTERGH
jgi:hypothetical protein